MKKNLHLTISAIIIIVVGLSYGVLPREFLPKLFDFEVSGIDLTSIFRATMGLYLAFAAFWLLGTIKTNYWKSATVSNIVFMGGLAFGRILSLFFDGIPSTPFTAGLLFELILLSWGIFNLKKYH